MGSKKNHSVRVCIIGAGISGICGAIKLRKAFPHWNLTICERSSEVGGVWIVNSYPGCGVDIPGHLYSFSFAPKSDWQRVYPKRAEILEYIESVVNKFGIRNLIRFNTSVISASWNSGTRKWLLSTVNSVSHLREEEEFDIVLNATGLFSSPNIPEIFNDFHGPIFHTAQWDNSICLKNKVVAVIGSGSSAVQVIPEISEEAKKLLLYQRSRPWVIPRVNYRYSKATKWIFQHIPFVRVIYRTLFFLINELNFLAFKTKLFLLGYFGHLIGYLLARLHLNFQVRSENHFQSVLKPSYTFGCKRVCISNRYYPSLLKPHVEVVTDPIKGIAERIKILTNDDTARPVDVIILATGFQVTKYLTFEIKLGEGKSIMSYDEFPNGYLGTIFTDIPNMFFIQGPGSDTLHNTAVFAIECQCDFIVRVMKHVERKDTDQTLFVVLKESEANLYKKWYDEALKKTVWKNSCDHVSTYFMTNDKRVCTLFPESLISFWWRLGTTNVSRTLDIE